MRRSTAVLLLGAFLAAACWEPSEELVRSGLMEARWTGSDTGQVSGPATAEWCPQRRLLEIRAVYGDTGFAIVLYPLDSVEEDTYRVVPPDGADSLAPSAAVALRLFSPNAIKGYRGNGGNVVLERSNSGELSGTIEARSRSVLNADTVRIRGNFRDLVVMPQTRGCLPEAPDDSIEAAEDSLEMFDESGLDPEPSDTDVN